MNAPCPSFPCYSTAHQYFIKFSFNPAMQKVKLTAPGSVGVIKWFVATWAQGEACSLLAGALINIKYHYSRVISS